MALRVPKNLLLVLLGISIGASYTVCFYYLNSGAAEEILIHPSLQSRLKRNHDQKWRRLDRQLQRKISRISKDGMHAVSVHLHDLRTGNEFRLNDEAPVSGGSLLKLPLIMGQLKHAEVNKDYFAHRVSISQEKYDELYSIQTLTNDRKLVSGGSYTVGELVTRTIIDSDNVAAVHLEGLLNNEPLKSVASDARMNLEDGKLTMKAYSGILKSLYHSTYLSPESSQSALSLLTHSDFSEGLRAGVPEEITVAHKFGEKLSASGDQIFFNHCGIIYLPRHPYVLCVSTLGKDYTRQIASVKKISAVVFNSISEI